MSVRKATVRNGKIELNAPDDWPEGTEVRIEPVVPVPASSCLRDEEWPDTPEGIARHLALMDRIGPMDITAEEEAEWEAARAVYGPGAMSTPRRSGTSGNAAIPAHRGSPAITRAATSGTAGGR